MTRCTSGLFCSSGTLMNSSTLNVPLPSVSSFLKRRASRRSSSASTELGYHILLPDLPLTIAQLHRHRCFVALQNSQINIPSQETAIAYHPNARIYSRLQIPHTKPASKRCVYARILMLSYVDYSRLTHTVHNTHTRVHADSIVCAYCPVAATARQARTPACACVNYSLFVYCTFKNCSSSSKPL